MPEPVPAFENKPGLVCFQTKLLSTEDGGYSQRAGTGIDTSVAPTVNVLVICMGQYIALNYEPGKPKR